VAFGEACCFGCCGPVVACGALEVSSEFQQMRSNSVQAVIIGEAGVRLEGSHQFQALRCSVDHGRGDGAIQRDHGVVRHAVQQIVKRQDLRPIGVLELSGFVVDGGSGGLPEECLRLEGATTMRLAWVGWGVRECGLRRRPPRKAAATTAGGNSGKGTGLKTRHYKWVF